MGGLSRQAWTSVGLGIAVLGAWVSIHVWAIFLADWSLATAPLALAAIAVECWLTVGLFIMAHDCMHGSFAPRIGWLNAMVGRGCVTLYACFDYDRLTAAHHAHHRESGTDADPDFDTRRPHSALAWYGRFMRRNLSVRQPLFFATAVSIEVWGFGADYWRPIAFWAIPALLSSFQLFYFGTYLPHRDGEQPFADRHHARTNEYGWLLSLATCFHFGYHHEHHAHPAVPWWSLPSRRAAVVLRAAPAAS